MSVTACVRWVQRLVCEKAWKTLCVCVCERERLRGKKGGREKGVDRLSGEDGCV